MNGRSDNPVAIVRSDQEICVARFVPERSAIADPTRRVPGLLCQTLGSRYGRSEFLIFWESDGVSAD